jgi:nitrogen-specific signal transduction histidine kinase
VLVEFSNTNVEFAGERLIFSVGRDVTDELRAQAQLLVSERMASVGLLAAGVAHEINNPLAAVVANLDLAARDLVALFGPGGAPPALAEIEGEIRDAREAAGHVRSLVRDLKVFSRADEDRKTAVDVHHVLDSSIRMAWNEIRHRAQIVKDYSAVPLVYANESRLGQVFLNLVVNAAQAIPEGHANSNEIRIQTQTDSHGRVEITVSDSGPGISPQVLAQVFRPFFTTKPEGVGTGLGLTICHRIVTEMGGEIEVQNQPGGGASVRVTLPSGGSELSEPVQPPTSQPSRRRARILIVDDEALVGMAVRRALTPEHDVFYVASAQEALAKLTAGEHFDLVLCDLMMPEMTGMELHARLAKLAPETADRVVFLTGGAFTPRARAFLDDVPNARIEKPFDLATLEALVNERVR